MAEIPEKYKAFIETMEQLNIVPKVGNATEFKQWIQQQAQQTSETEGTVKMEPGTTATPKVVPYVQPPRISFFSGGSDKKGGETTYDLWKYEVQCLISEKVHSAKTISEAVRRSLRGEAGKVAMRLGPGASLLKLMEKMDSIYGVVDEQETIMSEFYNAKQHDDEDISTWSCRLEAILDKAISLGKVPSPQADAMLHDMLWKGLRPALKDISHYEKERYTSFDGLRIALRKLEKEFDYDHTKTKQSQATAKQAVPTTEDTNMTSTVLRQINARLDKLESGHESSQQYQQPQYRYQHRPFQRGYFRGRGRGYRGNYRGNSNSTGSQPPVSQNTKYPPITCRRCGQEGHIARGCRVNLNQQPAAKSLNLEESTPQGRK